MQFLYDFSCICYFFLVTSSLHLLSYLKIATVRHLGFLNFRIFVKNKIHICAYFYIDMQNLVKIGRSAADIAYFRFSKWRSSAILDFHIFAIFACANFYTDKQNCPQMNSDIVDTSKRTVFGCNHVVWAINGENPSTGSTWACSRDKCIFFTLR